jgi:hypothetical protein
MHANAHALELERKLITTTLKKLIQNRPSKEQLEAQGVLEADELAVLFTQLCHDADGEVRVSWSSLQRLLGTGNASIGLSLEEVEQLFREFDADNDGKLSFAEFLQLCDAAEVSTEDRVKADYERTRVRFMAVSRGEGWADLETAVGYPDVRAWLAEGLVDDNDVHAAWAEASKTASGTVDLGGFLVFLSLLEAKCAEGLRLRVHQKAEQRVERRLEGLKEGLLKMLRSRPGYSQLCNSGIYKDRGAAARSLLERSFVRTHMGRALSARPTSKELATMGINIQETDARLADFKEAREQVGLKLADRTDRRVLVDTGVLLPQTRMAEREFAAHLITRNIRDRPQAEELVAKGILQERGLKPLYVTLLLTVLRAARSTSAPTRELLDILKAHNWQPQQ